MPRFYSQDFVAQLYEQAVNNARSAWVPAEEVYAYGVDPAPTVPSWHERAQRIREEREARMRNDRERARVLGPHQRYKAVPSGQRLLMSSNNFFEVEDVCRRWSRKNHRRAVYITEQRARENDRIVAVFVRGQSRNPIDYI